MNDDPKATSVTVPPGGNWSKLFADLQLPAGQRLTKFLRNDKPANVTIVHDPQVELRDACYKRLVALGIAPSDPSQYDSSGFNTDGVYARPKTVEDLVAHALNTVGNLAQQYLQTDRYDETSFPAAIEDHYRKCLARKRELLQKPADGVRGEAPKDVRFPDGFIPFVIKEYHGDVTAHDFTGDQVTVTKENIGYVIRADLEMVACKAALAELGFSNHPLLGDGAKR